MELIARGAASGVTLFWQRGSGWVLTVISKVAFELTPGDAILRAEPPAPGDRDVPWDAPYARTLRAINDLVPMKPNVDVFLTGHAYSSAGRPVRALTARLVVGTLDKSIEITTDRYFDRAGVLVDAGAPFAHMPLVYERAAGGPGTWNLAGIHVGSRDARGHVPLPNLMLAGQQLLSPDKLFLAPAGFGPIPPDWPSRVEKLGRRSLRDIPPRWHGQPLPDDFPREYFNAAPPDQQLTTLPDELTITLEHLHAAHPKLGCRIPPLRPTISCEAAGSTANIIPRIDTLHIDTDRAVCTIVWRGHLPLRDHREVTRVTVSLDPPARIKRMPTLTGAERVVAVPEQADPTSVLSSQFEGTIGPGRAPSVDLPFPQGPRPVPSPPSPSRAGGPQQSSLAQSWSGGSPPAPAPRPAADQLAQSWGGSSPGAPKPAEQSSPSWRAIDPAVARGALSNSGSWGEPAFGGADQTLPPPPAGAPAPIPMSTTQPEPAPSMAVLPVPLPAPPPAPPPPAPVSIVSMDASPTPVNDSPWVSGSPTAKRETIGMALAQGSLAVADPRPEPLPAVQLTPAATGRSSTSMQLLWFHPNHVARFRRVPAWRKLLEELQREPIERNLDESGTTMEPWEIEDRREVFEVIVRGTPSDTRGIEEALGDARRAGGKFVAPAALVEADIEVQLDELEALKAAATTAAPLITPTDEGLRAAVEAADLFLGRPGLSASPSVCTGLHTRIREAFLREKKGFPTDYLDKEVERALVAGRHYQKRRVLGGSCLRAFGWIPGDKEPIVTYLSEELTEKIPMYRRFRARMLGDVHGQQDQYESRALAFRVLAIARLG